MTQMQSDYEKRIHEVEAQRQQLLDEIEAREQELMNQVKKLDEECRQHKRKLKQATSDQEHSNKAYTTLASELDRSVGWERGGEEEEVESCGIYGFLV